MVRGHRCADRYLWLAGRASTTWSVGATGNLVQDAWFAALAIEAGCEWIRTSYFFKFSSCAFAWTLFGSSSTAFSSAAIAPGLSPLAFLIVAMVR